MPHDLPSPAMVASSKWLVRALLTLHAGSSCPTLPDLPGLGEALPSGSQSPVLVKPRRSWSSGLQPMPLMKAKTSISCPLQLVYCSHFSHIRLSLSSGESMGLVRRSVLRSLLLSLLFVGTMCTMPPGKTLSLLLWPPCRRPLPPSLHGTCRLSGLIYGLRPCLMQQASRHTPLCWSSANRDSSGRTKLAMDAALWASLVPGALPSSWDRRIRTAWWALCKRFMPTTSLSTPLTGNFPGPTPAHSWPTGPFCCPATPRSHQLGRRAACTPDSEPGRANCSHPSFDPMSEFPIYPRVTGAEANHCFWGYCGSRTNRTFAWYGTNQHGAFIRICNTTPKIRLRLPHTGCEEVLQDGYRLVLLPKLAFYALWDGHGESFVVPLPMGSATSATPVVATPPRLSTTQILRVVALTSRAFLQPR